MAWLDNIRNAMHPYDDDYIENEERAAEDEFSRQEDDIPADESFEDKQPRPVFSRRRAEAAAELQCSGAGKAEDEAQVRASRAVR